MKFINFDLKQLIFLLFMLLIYSRFSFCSKISKDIFVSNTDLFPQNINNNFSFTVKHPTMERHDLYAFFVLEVSCKATSQIQRLYFYPGFTSRLDHTLKETLFHVLQYNALRFETNIDVIFFREANDCIFKVEYSPAGAQYIHLRTPLDLLLIYTEKIVLFRPAIVTLSTVSDDGHPGGFTIDKKGYIKCTAKDGFPQIRPSLTLDKEIDGVMEPTSTSENSIIMNVIAYLKDHGTVATCKCGSVSMSKKINVFHHAQSVEIIPANQIWFKQGSLIQCKSLSGYPPPRVQWTVFQVNDTTSRFFTITSLPSTSTIRINPQAPNNSHWSLSCSSINIIPHLDKNGPSLLLNITIGENTSRSIFMSNYLWIIGVFVVIIVIVLAIALVCASNHMRCCNSSKKVSKKDSVPNQQYLPVTQLDVPDHHPSVSKEMDTFV